MTRLTALVATALLFAPKRQFPLKKPVIETNGSLDHVAIPRIDVTLRSDAALVTLDVTFGRGTWRSGDVAMHVAYGAPGVPIAFDARVTALEDGRYFPADDGAFTAVANETEASAPKDASIVLGSSAFAGEKITLDEKTLASAFERSPLVAVRIRAVYRVSNEADRSLVVRIAPDRGEPPPLGAIIVRSDGATLKNASAALCRSDGSAPRPLALAGARPTSALPLPLRAPRSAGESLCVSATLDHS